MKFVYQPSDADGQISNFSNFSREQTGIADSAETPPLRDDAEPLGRRETRRSAFAASSTAQENRSVSASPPAKAAKAAKGSVRIWSEDAATGELYADGVETQHEPTAAPVIARCLFRGCARLTRSGNSAYCSEHRGLADSGELGGHRKDIPESDASSAFVVNPGVLMTLAKRHDWKALPLEPGIRPAALHECGGRSRARAVSACSGWLRKPLIGSGPKTP